MACVAPTAAVSIAAGRSPVAPRSSSVRGCSSSGRCFGRPRAAVIAAASDEDVAGVNTPPPGAAPVAGATSVDIAGARGGEKGKTVEDVFVARGLDWTRATTAEIAAAVRAKAITADDCEALDKSGLRSALDALGLPTSGKLEYMRTRLQRALLVDGADKTE